MQSTLQEQLLLLQQSNPHLDEQAGSLLFKPAIRSFTLEESIRMTYQRAKAFRNAYDTLIFDPVCVYINPRAGIAVKDISQITQQFWKMHQPALGTLELGLLPLSPLCNLFVSTRAPFAMERPELQPVLQAALDFNVS
jgi:hypothetical protein